MHTILGAGGAIANELTANLTRNHQPARLVSRKEPPVVPGTVFHRADLTDRGQTQEAIAGSSVVYLCAGLKYDVRVWQEQWPKIMQNVIEGCKRAGAKLVFFDNVYMYGRVEGAMTENTPYNPCSKKGEVRAKIATRLMEEVRSGNLTACIARSADFYGPRTKTGFLNVLIFDRLIKGKRPQWLGKDTLPHSYTFTPDAGKALYLLGRESSADGQVWHVPTAAPPLTGKEYIRLVSDALKVKGGNPMTMGRLMVKLGGWFDPLVGELYEMMYQNLYPYVFNSSKFEQAFGIAPSSYEEGIQITASAMLGNES